MFTSAGKSTTMPPMTARVQKSRPKIRMITGAIATSGTERSSIATGMRACSIPLLSWNTVAPSVATTSPAMKPIAASPRVTMRLAKIISRLASAAGTSKR